MSYNQSYKFYRSKISIQEVAYELGYRIDKSKGKNTPSFVLMNQNGKETDRIYINHPNNLENSIFWRRNPGPGRQAYGDVVAFIRENINCFTEAAGARNEIDAVNKVCQRMSNSVVDMNVVMATGQTNGTYIPQSERHFELSDFERERGNWQKAMRFFKERGIDDYTAQLFKDNYELIRDTKAGNKVSWKNLGFPYRHPGESAIVGYEIRGFGKFKSKAEGTDSAHACWIAYLGKRGTPDNIPAFEIEKIHIAESAYDVMSYVQLHQGRIDLDTSLFVSVGGTFTNDLMHRLFTAYPAATPVLHFDNDITGVMYDIRAASIKAGKVLRTTTANGEVVFHMNDKQFSVPADQLSYNQFIQASGLNSEARPKVGIEKAPGEFKDWNEVLQTAMMAEKDQQKSYKENPGYGKLNNPAPNPEEEAEPRKFHR